LCGSQENCALRIVFFRKGELIMSKFKYSSKLPNDHDRRKEILKDLKTVCKKHCISKQAVYDIAWRISWEWTDNTGAYVGCPFWTEGALKILFSGFQNTNELIEKKAISENVKSKVIHEHIVPRNYFINYIISCYEKYEAPTMENLSKMVACVVTKEEDARISKRGYKKTMPNNITSLEKVDNPWQRYINSDITKIYQITWDNKIIKNITLIDITNF
jgi:hypothetical protein